MRLFKNPQMKIGEIRIEDIQIDKTSKDDVPRLLVWLQSIYSDKELLKKISDIMMKKWSDPQKSDQYKRDIFNIKIYK